MSGKGRGRGWLNIEKSTNHESRPGPDHAHSANQQLSAPADYPSPSADNFVINPQYEKIVHAIAHFNANDDGILLNQKFNYVKEVLTDSCKASNETEDAVEYLFNKATSDSNFTNKFIMFVSLNTFRQLVIADCALRGEFIALMQSRFKAASSILASNRAGFKNTIRIIAGFYEKACIQGQQNYKMLAPAILHCLSLSLDSVIEEDMEFVTKILYACGPKFIEDSIDFKELGIKMRTILASNTSSLSENSKLWLLFAIDLSNSEFRVRSPDLLNFYQMKLGNNDLFSFKTPLTVECTNSSVNNKLQNFASNVNVLSIDTCMLQLQMSNNITTNANNTQQNQRNLQNQPNQTPESVGGNGRVPNGDSQKYAPRRFTKPNKPMPGGGRPILGSGAGNNSTHTQRNTNHHSEYSDSRDSKFDMSNTYGQDQQYGMNQRKYGNPHDPHTMSEWKSPNMGREGGNNTRKTRKGWEHDDRFETEYD